MSMMNQVINSETVQYFLDLLVINIVFVATGLFEVVSRLT